jgi:hypothetical protein
MHGCNAPTAAAPAHNPLSTYTAGDVEARSFKVLKPRGHYQSIANEKLSPASLLAG